MLPEWKPLNDAQCAAPCMSGGVGMVFMPPVFARATTSSMDFASPAGPRPPRAPMKMSAWRQSTPFGMPVVPPV